MKLPSPLRYNRQGMVVVLSIDSPSDRALGRPARAALIEGLSRAENDEGVRAVVLIRGDCGAVPAICGRNLDEPPSAASLAAICAQLETAQILVVASLHGICLGNGLEIALAAHYRIAQPASTFGFPHVSHGLIPNAGETQRLPRLTGVEAAVSLITSGRQFTAYEAYELGIIDEIAGEDPVQAGVDYALKLLKRGAAHRQVRSLPAANPIDWDATRAKIRERAQGRIAPLFAIDAIRASVELSFEEGLKEECRLCTQLTQSDQRRALLHSFAVQQKALGNSDQNSAAPRDVSRLGVVGGGKMGAGIATIALLSNLQVTLVETSQASGDAAKDRISQILEAVLQGEDAENIVDSSILLGNLTVSTDYGAMRTADIVIEAVFEDMAVKKAVFSFLDAVCKPGAILASNTSFLDVNEMADATARPEDVLGLHFFSPAYVTPLLEVVVPKRASAQTVATGTLLAQKLGKMSVRCAADDGFIGNRIMEAYRNASDQMVLEGASPSQIDRALEGFGFDIGPYAQRDIDGLSAGWASRQRLRQMQSSETDGSFALFPIRLRESGHFGRKSGAGYYLYGENIPAGTLNPKFLSCLAQERRERAIVERSFSSDEIIARSMGAMVNEAAKVIEAGTARHPRDIDLVLITAYGFPKHRGGPCMWADLTGLSALLTEIEKFAKDDPQFWRPAPLLEALVSEGKTFCDLNKLN
ncbi:MAG: 3-hydroxyacyl-CoA dehydrogenase NAD-binding domain-containing protein [Roseobacter sp.]